ncbi:hypothetical protein BASA81_012695 [Batrachochytrium salamandrivorans]|nr:hypothetical protein BASA81_012695 [Batrachochytrium salamandrivorans]
MSIHIGASHKISPETQSDIREFIKSKYPALNDEHVDLILGGNHFVVLLADDYKRETLRTKNARVVVATSREEVREITARYSISEYAVLWLYDFIAPDFLIGAHVNAAVGVSMRLPYPVTLDLGLENLVQLNMLVDTGSPTTIVVVPSSVFAQLAVVQNPEEIKGLDTSLKRATGIMYINDEEVGELQLVRSGGGFARYLKNQFDDCSGILGMDMLGNCNVSLCRGRVVIYRATSQVTVQISSPHHAATRRNNRAFLENRWRPHNTTMLHVFASQGNLVNVLNYVEKHNRSVEDVNYNLQTPLHLASAYGRLEVVKYLLSKHNTNVFQRDRWGNTPVDLALRGHFYDCVQVLLANSSHLPLPVRPSPLVDVNDASYQLFLLIAQPDHADKGGGGDTLQPISQLLELLTENATVDEIVDAEQRTPAHLAAACGKLVVLELLHTTYQCNFLTLDGLGRTSVDEASKFNHLECMEFLERVTAHQTNLSLQELHELGTKEGWAYEERTVAFRLSPDTLNEGKFFKLPCITKPLQRVDLEYQDLKSDWREEIQTIARLRHPYIQEFYGTSLLTVPYPLLLVEQPLTTLDKLLTERALDPGSKPLLSGDHQRRILSQIALGLLYLHSHDIVYRSLDAHHVLVFGSDLCKLAIPPTQSILEDKEYRFMAPELVRAKTKREYLPSCDIYSFGMVAYWLFSGHRPFREEREVKEAVMRGRRPDLKLVPNEQMQTLIALCWDENPEARLRIHELLQRFDAEKAVGLTPTAAMSSSSPKSSSSGRRNRMSFFNRA